MSQSPRRRVHALAALVAGVVVLTACDSQPSTRRVARDIIEAVEGLSEAERECMRERLADYTDDDLAAINENNDDVDFDAENPAASPEWQAFTNDLRECAGRSPSASGSAAGAPAASGPGSSAPAAAANTAPSASGPVSTIQASSVPSTDG